eukprot:4387504-Amphidinium_carterae.2
MSLRPELMQFSLKLLRLFLAKKERPPPRLGRCCLVETKPALLLEWKGTGEGGWTGEGAVAGAVGLG